MRLMQIVLPVPRVPYHWSQEWKPSTASTPHVKTYARRKLSGVVTVYVEKGNADVIPGVQGSARPTFDCDVETVAPRGYVLVEDTVRAWPWPSRWFPMHAAVRRYAMYPRAKPELRPDAEREARGYYQGRWRRGRLAYGPCGVPMPDLTAAQRAAGAQAVSGWLGHLRSLLASPAGATGGVEDSQDGLLTGPLYGWRPWGIPERYAHAGSGIRFYTGHEQAPDLPAYLWLAVCANHERRWHALNRANGEPLTAESYGNPGPMYQEGTGDPNNSWLPEFRGVAQHPDPIIFPYDQGHSIRGFRHLIALSEMETAPMVARMLRSQAAQFRLQFSEIGPLPHASGYVPPSLRTSLGWAMNSPGTGIFGQDNGRRLGWPAFVIAQSVKRAGANENRTWCSKFCDLIEWAVMPNGIVSRCSEPVGGDPVWFDPNHDTAHAFEIPILMHGYVGCAKVTGRPIPPRMLRYAASLYEEAPLLPYYSGHGPPNYSYVAKRGGNPYPSIPGGKIDKGGDSSNAHPGAALAAHLDPQFRNRWIQAGLRIKPVGPLEDSAGLVAQMQRTTP